MKILMIKDIDALKAIMVQMKQDRKEVKLEHITLEIIEDLLDLPIDMCSIATEQAEEVVRLREKLNENS